MGFILRIVLLIFILLNGVSFAQTTEEEANTQTENIENTEVENMESDNSNNNGEAEQIQGSLIGEDNFIMNYNLIDIIPIEPDRNLFTVMSNVNGFENGIKSHRHSLGIDFGTAIFATLNAPVLFNLAFKQTEDSPRQTLEGKFGFRLTYTYRFTEKIDLDATFGLYVLNTYYTNSTAEYFGGTYAIPLSLGLRFYFNKRDRASGFFLLPKIGATIFVTKGNETTIADGNIIGTAKKNSTLFDFYVSSEMGFRIDMSRKLGINSGVRPFIDISLLDIGVSYSYIFRFIPLPRLAIGVLF